MTAQELVARLPSKAKWIIGFVVLLSGNHRGRSDWCLAPCVDVSVARLDGFGVAIHRCEA